MQTKTYKLKFYRGILGEPKMKNNLHASIKKKNPTIGDEITLPESNETLKFHNINEDFTYGEIRKRRVDLPGVTNSTTDKDLTLAEDESLFESNQFLISRDRNILIYQVNVKGCAVSRLSKLIGKFLENETATFSPIIQSEAVNKLMKENKPVKSFSCSYSVPHNLEIYKDLNMFVQFDSLVEGTGHVNFSMSLGKGNKGGSLLNLFKKDEFKDTMELDVTSAKIEDMDGNPINLLENQIISDVQIARHDRLKIMREKIINGLDLAYKKNKAEIIKLYDD